jgi:hypothetical protein
MERKLAETSKHKRGHWQMVAGQVVARVVGAVVVLETPLYKR